MSDTDPQERIVGEVRELVEAIAGWEKECEELAVKYHDPEEMERWNFYKGQALAYHQAGGYLIEILDYGGKHKAQSHGTTVIDPTEQTRNDPPQIPSHAQLEVEKERHREKEQGDEPVMPPQDWRP
jgi:hypothetical protein